LALERDK